jgi:hypothetical protein
VNRFIDHLQVETTNNCNTIPSSTLYKSLQCLHWSLLGNSPQQWRFVSVCAHAVTVWGISHNLIIAPSLLSFSCRIQLSWLQLLGADHIENTALLLLCAYSLPRERVNGAVIKKRPLFIRLCRSRCMATFILYSPVFTKDSEMITSAQVSGSTVF